MFPVTQNLKRNARMQFLFYLLFSAKSNQTIGDASILRFRSLLWNKFFCHTPNLTEKNLFQNIIRNKYAFYQRPYLERQEVLNLNFFLVWPNITLIPRTSFNYPNANSQIRTKDGERILPKYFWHLQNLDANLIFW